MISRGAFLSQSLAAIAAPGFSPGVVLQQSTIGINVPLTGDYAQYGQQIVAGVQAAIDEQNRFGTLSRAWGLRTFDDRNNGSVATSNVFVAASDPSIIGMIGNLTAEITLQALPQYANANFVVVVPSVTADAITARGFRNVYRLPTKDSTEGALVARAVLAGKAGTSVLALTSDGAYGFDTAQGFVAQAKADKHRADILAFDAGADPKNAAAVALQHAPTYVFLSGKPDKLGPVAAALRDQGYAGAFGASDGFYTTATTDTFAKPLDGALIASSLPPLERVPSAAAFLPDFRNEIAQTTAFSAYGYAAAQLIIQAAQRANATNRFQLLTQLQEGGSYTLLVGQYSFLPTGDATIPNVYLFRVTDKGFVFEKPAVANGFVL